METNEKFFFDIEDYIETGNSIPSQATLIKLSFFLDYLTTCCEIVEFEDELKLKEKGSYHENIHDLIEKEDHEKIRALLGKVFNHLKATSTSGATSLHHFALSSAHFISSSTQDTSSPEDFHETMNKVIHRLHQMAVENLTKVSGIPFNDEEKIKNYLKEADKQGKALSGDKKCWMKLHEFLIYTKIASFPPTTRQLITSYIEETIERVKQESNPPGLKNMLKGVDFIRIPYGLNLFIYLSWFLSKLRDKSDELIQEYFKLVSEYVSYQFKRPSINQSLIELVSVLDDCRNSHLYGVVGTTTKQ